MQGERLRQHARNTIIAPNGPLQRSLVDYSVRAQP